jgi:hypothetical protein
MPWVEIIDKTGLADPGYIYPYAWLIYKGKGKTDFTRVRLYNTRENFTVTQVLQNHQIRELTDKEVFVLLIKDKATLATIAESVNVVY